MLSLSMFTRPYNLILVIPVFALIARLVATKPHQSISAAKWVVLAASLVFVQPISPLGAENALVGNSFADWRPAAKAIWVLLIVPAQTYLLLLIFAALLWDLLGKVPRTSAPYLARGLER